MKKQPNILWICTDQQRFDTLGCYGNSHVNTPNIDRLAARGVQFQNSFCQSPICSPSRASFLTGRYPRTTRVRQNGQSIPGDEILVTRLLSEAGYICGLSGKLHISACNPSVCSGTEPRIQDGYDEFHWSHHHKPDWPTNEYTQWLEEQGIQYQTEASDESDYVEYGMKAEYHQTTWCAEKASTFIRANASFSNPWLFSVNIFDPHHPFDPPVELFKKYMDISDEIPLPSYTQGELETKSVFQTIDHKGAYGTQGNYPFDAMNENDHKALRAAYWAMIELIDQQVGRLLDVLDETGELENTIVIFMSDHGEMLGDHGIYLKGPYFYEPAIRVPLVISWPGVVQQGVVKDALVELVDLAPTLLDASGISKHEGMQGSSLWTLLTGEKSEDEHRDNVYCEYYNTQTWHTNPAANATMVRGKRYKLSYFHGLNTAELYDLVTDPNETSNLWNVGGYEAIKLDMMEQLADRMAWTNDPLPPRQSKW